MIIQNIAGVYYGLAHEQENNGAYFASGKTALEVITKLLANFYNHN